MSDSSKNTLSKMPFQNVDKRREVMRQGLELVINVVVIFAIVFSIRYAFISPFQVSGNSMEGNLHDADYILVSRANYFVSDPEFGDVVVLHPPKDEEHYYVKRVIGTPGDTLSFKNGYVYLTNDEYPDGYKLPVDYLSQGNRGMTYIRSKQNKDIKLGNNEYFVMGDNRRFSSDSRSWYAGDKQSHGAVSKEKIIGKAWAVVFPEPRLIEHTGLSKD